MKPGTGLQDRWDGHLVLVHHSERERRDGLGAWIHRGLSTGAKIYYLELPDVPEEESFRAVMREHDAGLDPAFDAGRLQVVPMTERSLTPAWQAQVVEEALDAGFPAVRISGESSKATQVVPASQHREAERAAEELCRTRPLSVLCQYPARASQPELDCVLAQHPAGLRETMLETFPGWHGLTLVGEIDVSNERVIRSVIRAACLSAEQTSGLVTLDLSRVAFLDVAGTRAILSATREHRRDGGTLLLRRPQPLVRRILRLLAADRVEGVTIEEVEVHHA